MTRELRITAILGALAVGIGAFGAHGLKALVGPEELVTFNTGVRYHFYHVFAMGLAVALSFSNKLNPTWIIRAIWAWFIGICLFSGSLYLLTLKEQTGLPTAFLGPITPIGGLFFICGWICLFFAPKPTA